MKSIRNPEKVISENAKSTYRYNCPSTTLTDVEKADDYREHMKAKYSAVIKTILAVI